MRVGLGADHGGFELKEKIKKYLIDKGYDVHDYGTHSSDSVDYAQFARKVSEAVLSEEVDRGILFCGTGIGIGISANKIQGIRCACISEPYSAKMSRRHNNANVIAIGGRVVAQGLAELIVDSYLEEEFEGGRHQRRIDQIAELEGYCTLV